MIEQLKELTAAAGRAFSRFESTCGISDGVPLSLDTVRRFAQAGVHRLMVFTPGFVPRSKFDTDLYPRMQRFADEVIANV